MANTAKELSTPSNVSVHLQVLDKIHIILSLKYEDHKNEDCSLYYPKRRNESKSTWCQSYAPYNSIQMTKNPAGSINDRPKVLVEKGSIALFSL